MSAEMYPRERELVMNETTAVAVDVPFPLRIPLPSTAWLCLLGGIGIALLQVVMMLLLGPPWDLHSRYLTLVQHDSFWFGNIIERGYASPVPPSPVKMYEVSNVAFFPGYPLLVTFMKQLFGLNTTVALVLTAQLAATGFWAYVLAFLRRWQTPWCVGFLGCAVIAAHPAAFFLVVGYSESLFLMMVLGFLYWMSARSPAAPWLALLHGFGMSATRIVGLPCCVANIVDRVARSIREHRWESLRHVPGFVRTNRTQFIITGISMLGGISFFAFCQWEFGHWDFYMQTQLAGWGVRPDYLAFFKPQVYAQMYPDWRDGLQLSQFCVPVTIMIAIALAGWELILALRGRETHFIARVPFYFTGALIFYVSVCGVTSVELQSMIRYQFCTHAIVGLGVIHLISQLDVRDARARWIAATATALVTALLFYAQQFHASGFTLGGWVA
jgi:hypothetical protein